MKTGTFIQIHLNIAHFCAAICFTAILSPPCSDAAVGYVNVIIHPGLNYFGNPLDDGSGNLLHDLIPAVPAGTTASLWNPSSGLYAPVSIFDGRSWSTDFQMSPGTGFVMNAPSMSNTTWVGTVLDFNGNRAQYDPSIGDLGFHAPPPFTGPNGLYLLSSVAPFNLGVTAKYPEWYYIVGRDPNPGESVWTYNQTTALFDHTTFNGTDWDNGAPTLTVGQAAFFNIGGMPSLSPVPEPGTVSLLLIGAATFGLRSAGRRSV